MRFWPFNRGRTQPQRDHHLPRPAGPDPAERPVIIPFPPETFELANAKRHGLRALVGLLADRHSDCLLRHPFCGPLPGPSEGNLSAVVFATSQTDAVTADPLIALYLCRAEPAPKHLAAIEPVPPLEYAALMAPKHTVPDAKVVVNQVSDGTYHAQLGPIANPVEGDYSTGHLDPNDSVFQLRLNPQPTHARWEYYESRITQGQTAEPEYHCFMLRGEWWVVDVDRRRQIYQQVAALQFADNPDHSFPRP